MGTSATHILDTASLLAALDERGPRLCAPRFGLNGTQHRIDEVGAFPSGISCMLCYDTKLAIESLDPHPLPCILEH